MTARRHQRKPSVRLLTVAVLLAAMIAPGTVPSGAATTELIVTDRYSGLAISGYDPVAYFTDQTAREGKSEFELRQSGVTWRFANEGNRAAFAADPDVFAPRFGGYDPVAVARGSSTPGHPALWLVLDDRLYLFHSEAARDGFIRDHDRIIDLAERRWPQVQRVLSP